MNDAAWGTLSNQAVAAAAVVYFLALLAHVVEWASLRQVDRAMVVVGPGGGEVVAPPPAPRPDVERQQDRVAMFGRLGPAPDRDRGRRPLARAVRPRDERGPQPGAVGQHV